jgi:tape measure domain-containing protein
MAVSSKIILRFDGAAVKKGLAEVKKAFGSLNKSAGGFFTDIIGKTTKWLAILGPLAAGGIFAKFTMGASETASNFEQMRMSFLMFTGSLEGAAKLMDQLRSVDLVSNLDLETLGQGAKTLMSYSLSADEAASTVEKLSKISGGSAERFQSLALAFGQSTGAGILKGDDLKQYTENGWNPLQQIMAKTGETYLQVRKRMEAHGVTLKEVKSSLVEVTSGTGRFARAHELGSKTFLAATSRMSSQWKQFQDAFGTPLNKHLVKIFDQVTARIQGLRSAAAEWGEYFGRIITGIFNSVGNGSFMELVKTGFLAAAGLAGEKLIAALIYGGTVVGNQFRDLLRSVEIGGYKASVGPNVDMSWKQASSLAENTFGGQENLNAFNQVLDKNKEPLVGPLPLSKPGDSGYTSLADTMKQAVEELKKANAEARLTNRNLSPSP